MFTIEWPLGCSSVNLGLLNVSHRFTQWHWVVFWQPIKYFFWIITFLDVAPSCLLTQVQGGHSVYPCIYPSFRFDKTKTASDKLLAHAQQNPTLFPEILGNFGAAKLEPGNPVEFHWQIIRRHAFTVDRGTKQATNLRTLHPSHQRRLRQELNLPLIYGCYKDVQKKKSDS